MIPALLYVTGYFLVSLIPFGSCGDIKLSSAYFYVATNAAWSDMIIVNANNFMIAGFQELLADLVDAARAHCQLIVVSKWDSSYLYTMSIVYL